MTVYAVLRIKDYSLVNIHQSLDRAISQVARLETHGEHMLKVHVDLEDSMTHLESEAHVIQPYEV